MTLSGKAIKELRNYKAQSELSDLLKCSPRTIVRYLDNNESNGPLTTVGAVKRIKELTGLKQSEILESEPAPAK
jgi:DeoR/GlpR family transcriptional regulator of sugar metabolism